MNNIHITISNVGGIDELECAFTEPITVITGPNASNKTSILQAIAFALGHSNVPIKTDAEKARVKLEYEGTSIVRTAKKTDNGVSIDGTAWLEAEDAELLERFACLLEFNDLRTAVRHGDSIESLLKSPMDLNALEREQSEKIARKRELKHERESLANVESTLAETEDKLANARARAGELSSRLETLRAERDVAADGDDTVKELQNQRAELVTQREDARNRIDAFEEAINRLDDQIIDKEAELNEVRNRVKSNDLGELKNERQRIQETLHDVNDRIDVLQSVYTTNREMLSSAYTNALGGERGFVEDTITCWACGNDATKSDFEETIDELNSLIDREKETRREYDPRLQELEEEIGSMESAKSRLKSMETEHQRLLENKTERTESLETKRAHLDEVMEQIETIDERLAERESDQREELTDVSTEIEETRVELHEAERTIERLESEEDDLHEDISRRDEIDDQLADLDEKIAELTDRIETLEDQIRDEFNTAMDELLDILDYERIERVWLDGDFSLVIARDADGVTQRDRVEHLSESERETIALILALAGYLSYDVADHVPVLLIDTLGAFDSERTATLLGYFTERVPYLVTALLPDNAEAIVTSSYPTDCLQMTELPMSQS